MDRAEYLKASFEKIQIIISEKQVNQFLEYTDLLLEWNQKINLTAITEFEDIVWKHFIDSVSVNQAGNVSRETWNKKILDLGTGAGFPGIPLKIIYPEGKYVLVDSLNKRILFLEEVIKKCNLKNIKAVHGRAEDLAHDPKYREQFDAVVSRAVANLATLNEYCIPFIRKGGIFISYKAGNSEKEIKDASKSIKVFGGELVGTDSFIIPGSDLSRTIVTIKKVTNTPKKYPRKAGLPGKSPILN